MEKGEPGHEHPHRERKPHSREQRLFGPFCFARAHILRYKGGHGLVKGRRHEHDKAAQLFRHTHSGRGYYPQGIHDSGNGQEGYAYQQILESNGQTETEYASHPLFIENNILPAERKGKLLLSYYQDGNNHTERLGAHRGNGGSRSSQPKYADQQKISCNIKYTGDCHRYEGHPRITDSAENTSQHVIGYNKKRTCRTDTHVHHGSVKCFRRSLHDPGNRYCTQLHQERNHNADKEEQNHTGPDDFSCFLRFALTQLSSKQYGSPHGNTHYKGSDQLHQPASRGNRRNICRCGKLPYHKHIHGSIHRLKKQGCQNGQCKTYKG